VKHKSRKISENIQGIININESNPDKYLQFNKTRSIDEEQQSQKADLGMSFTNAFNTSLEADKNAALGMSFTSQMN
jgi:hypothetical protein